VYSSEGDKELRLQIGKIRDSRSFGLCRPFRAECGFPPCPQGRCPWLYEWRTFGAAESINGLLQQIRNAPQGFRDFSNSRTAASAENWIWVMEILIQTADFPEGTFVFPQWRRCADWVPKPFGPKAAYSPQSDVSMLSSPGPASASCNDHRSYECSRKQYRPVSRRIRVSTVSTPCFRLPHSSLITPPSSLITHHSSLIIITHSSSSSLIIIIHHSSLLTHLSFVGRQSNSGVANTVNKVSMPERNPPVSLGQRFNDGC
jgi:hypothetical protein